MDERNAGNISLCQKNKSLYTNPTYITSSFACPDMCSLYLNCHSYHPPSISNFICQGPGQMSLPPGGRWHLQVKLIASSCRFSRDSPCFSEHLEKCFNCFCPSVLPDYKPLENKSFVYLFFYLQNQKSTQHRANT